jgi:hypothetical protein
MKHIFCKIIELPTDQVLLRKDWSDEDQQFQLVVTVALPGQMFSLKLGYNDEAKRDEIFDKYNEADAQKYVDRFVKKHGVDHM